MAAKQIKEVSLKDIEDSFPPGSSIPAIGGKIIKLYKPTNGDGEHGPYTKQGAEIESEDQEASVNVTFWNNDGADSPLIPTGARGSRIHIESTVSKGKSNGIKMGNPYKGVSQISVTQAAAISWPDGEPKEWKGGNKTENGSGDQKGASTKSSSGTSGGGEEDADDEPFEERVEGWFKGFGIVCEAAGHKPDEVMEKFSPSDLKEITTGLAASFKARYSMHRKIHFRGELGKSSESVSGDEAAKNEEPKKETILKWQDVEYPTKPTPTPLGKLAKARLQNVIKWAFTTDPEKVGVETKRIIAAAHLAAAELNVTPKFLVEEAIAVSDGYTDEKYDFYAQQEYGVASRSLTHENYLDMLGKLEEVVKGIAGAEVGGESGDVPNI